jgi:small subunit ribosomal protein S13
MARIEGVDLPRNKRVEIGLTYLFGIGLTRSHEILAATRVNPDTRIKDLTETEVSALREYITKNLKVEGDLRRDEQMNIKRLVALARMPAPEKVRKRPLPDVDAVVAQRSKPFRE